MVSTDVGNKLTCLVWVWLFRSPQGGKKLFVNSCLQLLNDWQIYLIFAHIITEFTTATITTC